MRPSNAVSNFLTPEGSLAVGNFRDALIGMFFSSDSAVAFRIFRSTRLILSLLHAMTMALDRVLLARIRILR